MSYSGNKQKTHDYQIFPFENNKWYEFHKCVFNTVKVLLFEDLWFRISMK